MLIKAWWERTSCLHLRYKQRKNQSKNQNTHQESFFEFGQHTKS